MSEADLPDDLPDDLTRWPTDPYQLLGVSREADARELRRAYTKLIRVYKPEQSPEQFRRIREAYEHALRTREYQRWREPLEEAKPDAGNGGEITPPDAGSSHAVSSMPSLDGQMRHAWELAVAGKEAEAYAQLRDLQQAYPGEAEICSRLYWLLTLDAKLDPVRSPCDWLVAGMRVAGRAGPLQELYRRELTDDPREAVSERCTTLLDSPIPANPLIDLLGWRWEAAFRLGAVAPVIARDVPAARPRIVRENEEGWARLLIQAIHRLAWEGQAPAPILLAELRREVESLEHLHQRLHYDLDTLDHLAEITAGWYRIRHDPEVPNELAEVVRLSWDRPWQEYRPLLWRLLDDVAAAPLKTLTLFDRLRTIAPAVLAQLGLAFVSPRYYDERPTGSAVLSLDAVREFVDLTSWRDYAAFRRLLLDFCIREATTPEVVGEVLLSDLVHPYWLADMPLGQRILEDWPLRYLVMALRLFWE